MIINCEICGIEFEGRMRRYSPKYCSNECRYKGQLRKQNEWRKKKRARIRMGWLVKNQQFADECSIPKDSKCWVCGSEKDLLTHHVKYYPRVVIKTLCRSCHEFLHKALLRHKKCNPNNA